MIRRAPDAALGGAHAFAQLARACRSCALSVAVAASAAPAIGQTWRFDPSIELQGTATNNVNLAPTNSRTADFVTTITPALSMSERGERTRLYGSISVPVVLYARTGAENNNVYPTLRLLGDIDLYNRILHVEGSVNVSQQFFTPFGAQPQDFVNGTENRYRTTTYRISPYLQGVAPNGIDYELRNINSWTNLSGAPITTSNSRYTEWIARAGSSEASQFGWRANYNYTDVRFDDQGSLQTNIARVVPFYNVSPMLQFEASLGYEDNQGLLTSSQGVVYGVGFRWQPTERTNVVGKWEHRFFGASYLFSFAHRTPLSIWNVQASRNITTYPQQLAALTGGTDVAGFVNNLYLSSIPDAAARAQVVAQFLQERGLPQTLNGPVTLYAQQIILEQRQSASVGFIGVRNTLLFSVFNVRSEPISAAGTPLPPFLTLGNANTQTGGGIVWTNRLTQAVNLLASVDAFRTVANEGTAAMTRQGNARFTLSFPLSAHTTGFVGARYQSLISDVAPGYNEAAAFFGINYVFR